MQLKKKNSKKFMTIQIIMIPLWSFQHTIFFKKMSPHLGGSFDYVFAQIAPKMANEVYIYSEWHIPQAFVIYIYIYID